MAEWAQVRWTEARQLVAFQGVAPDALPPEGKPPAEHFADLRAAGDRKGAVQFLALALPRYESIAWSAHVIEEVANARKLAGPDRAALDYALRWLGEPNDDRRRAAFAAADAAGERAPERFLGMAVFFSGGSISGVDLPPVPPAPELTGKMAGGALTFATDHAVDPVATLDRALDLGEKVAEQGMQALTTA